MFFDFTFVDTTLPLPSVAHGGTGRRRVLNSTFFTSPGVVRLKGMPAKACALSSSSFSRRISASLRAQRIKEFQQGTYWV